MLKDEDEKFVRATQISTEDVGKAQGKSGKSPNSISELLVAIECYIIHLEAFLTDKGHHQRMVRQLRAVL